MLIGSMMREAREATRLTGPAVADACGVTHSAVYQWERGLTRPRAVSFARWLDAVGVPPDERAHWWASLADATSAKEVEL